MLWPVSSIDAHDDEKGALPAQQPELPSSVTTIQHEGRTFHLVGTAHVSEKSVDDVKTVIAMTSPDTVCVELCKVRHEALTDSSRWAKLDVFQVVRQGKVLFLLAHLFLSGYQRRLGDRLGVKPGAELLAAIDAANEVGARVVLADRDVQTTLLRTWRNLGIFSKLQLLASLLFSRSSARDITVEEIERLKEHDHLSEAIDGLARVFPRVKVPLIDERDDYLRDSIAKSDGEKVVAVVGAGHVRGIVERFGEAVDREALDVVTPPGLLGRSLKWLIPAIVLLAFVVGIKRHDFTALDSMLLAWILPNALFAGLGTIIAGARPLTILVTIVASPITSLNPTLNAGMVAGLVEAWMRRPTVEDCERVPDDSRTLRGIYKNPFTRVLLVSALAILGSASGAWIGMGWLVALVAR